MDKRNKGFEKGDRVRLIYERGDEIKLGDEGTIVRIYKGDMFPDAVNPIQVRYDKHPGFIYFENGDTIEKI